MAFVLLNHSLSIEKLPSEDYDGKERHGSLTLTLESDEPDDLSLNAMIDCEGSMFRGATFYIPRAAAQEIARFILSLPPVKGDC